MTSYNLAITFDMTLFQCKWYNDKRQRFKFVFVRFCNTICRALDENKVGCRKAARCCRKSASPDQIDMIVARGHCRCLQEYHYIFKNIEEKLAILQRYRSKKNPTGNTYQKQLSQCLFVCFERTRVVAKG